MDKSENFIIFVSGSTPTKNLGQSISAALMTREEVYVRCIGANANHQAAKGIITARSSMSAKGQDFTMVMYFTDVQLTEKMVTAIEYRLVRKNN